MGGDHDAGGLSLEEIAARRLTCADGEPKTRAGRHGAERPRRSPRRSGRATRACCRCIRREPRRSPAAGAPCSCRTCGARRRAHHAGWESGAVVDEVGELPDASSVRIASYRGHARDNARRPRAALPQHLLGPHQAQITEQHGGRFAEVVRRPGQSSGSVPGRELHVGASPPWTPVSRRWSSPPSPGSPANHRHCLTPRTPRAQSQAVLVRRCRNADRPSGSGSTPRPHRAPPVRRARCGHRRFGSHD